MASTGLASKLVFAALVFAALDSGRPARRVGDDFFTLIRMPCPVFTTPEREQFQYGLLAWFHSHQRDLPWRRTRDPYAIWVSEIMLQQTRVAAVIPYYERFLGRFPDFRALAGAPEQDLLAHWAGLGYYHRARNLQKAAQVMRDTGTFPASHADILVLPGIGEYTAAAVASIAFDLPHAVLDGNVMRVLSRLFADPADIASRKSRTHFSVLAEELLDRRNPGAFNQAMMELGAMVCTPKNPQCLLCPAASLCQARAQSLQHLFPVKAAKQKSVPEERTVFWIGRNRHVLLWQRPADFRLMPGFWELPEQAQLPQAVVAEKLGSFRHSITFHDYRFAVWSAQIPFELGSCRWMALDDLPSAPVSTVVKKAWRAVAKQVRALSPASG